MVDLSSIIALGVVATALPTLVGSLLAYSIVATILGLFLWAANSVPDDVGIAVAGSGSFIGTMIVGGILIIRFLFA